ncbi:carboxypeptidase-like regulatory domain-containing protein, partial [Marseilla massiliensis]|nr:carboxypeptidase-like regulatory domain-containing protein [Marseilla massiliensis]
NLKTFRLALVALFTLIVGSLSAQTVKGTVKDASGEPIIGATVQEKGTKNVAVTDLDGNFEIKTSGSNELQFSYIGMKPQTVNVTGKSTVNIVM